MGVESGKSFRLVFAPLIEGHVPRLATNAPGRSKTPAPKTALPTSGGVHFRGTTRYDI
jgi:hypothetical protein